MSSNIIDDTTAEPAGSPLGSINQYFHQLYADRKQHFRNKIKQGKVLLVIRMDSRLVISCGGEIQKYLVNGKTYHQLKALAHSTLAAYYSLLHSPLAEAVPRLKNWLQQMQSAPGPAIASEVTEIIGKLLQQVAHQHTLGHLQILEYARQLEPVFSQLLLQSAEDEVTQLHHQLSRITEKYAFATSDTFFIVMGGPQARSRELAKLVFTKWCNDTDDLLVDPQHHVRYLEGATSIEDAEDIIATMMTDGELAQTFLGQIEGLEQDILGKAAEEVIERCWPKPQS
ncbi:hypothetical protein SAMN06297280_2151 [Arsukibacterium tuosuense]|uniref:Uncharacterized protein n=1 Tax=Arsukibacterium tuosuense TaxID=1323745 RepID=A0A285IXI0_9GAMM|nr:hypothetical protein [Arsukibacterium tuosuense]SNY52543.1 hypothetical protein SAMN06297280_2151 [Arsukibacterium tuosuense]